MLAGLEHLQDLSTAAEPVEKDMAVARAWLQPGWDCATVGDEQRR
ncbi:MAG TPA: hypothetical protein VMT46_08670 [Anaerolineaceae bacterium]|nr:hypothetical protein [Anaerolineaceae bacterium]